MNLFQFPMAVVGTISQAIKNGIDDPNKLADLVFYFHYPELRASGIKRGMRNYDQLSKEWMRYHDMFAKEFGRAAANSPKSDDKVTWGPYEESNLKNHPFLSKDIKSWASKPPTHKREAAAFPCNALDGGRKLLCVIWKTNDPKHFCHGHNAHKVGSVHCWIELPLNYANIRARHNVEVNWLNYIGNDAGTKGIALMNFGVNVIVFHRVLKRGQCLRNAENGARRALAQEGKATYELMTKLVGGAGGAKISRPTGYSQINWHNFAKQIRKVAINDFEKAPMPNEAALQGISFDEQIVGGSGRPIGWVNYFD